MATTQNDIPPKGLSFQGPGTYRIRIQGTLARHWFDGLGDIHCTISQSADHKLVTTLVGQFRDQANLFGLLNTIYDLHLPLIQVEYLATPPPHETPADSYEYSQFNK